MIWTQSLFTSLQFLLFFGFITQHSNCTFSMDFCQLKCNTRPHTLCDKIANSKCPYKSHKVYSSQNLADVGLENHLNIAHNGIRERIAIRMRVANMVLIHWSKQLSQMAVNWAKMCRPYEDDECTHLSPPMSLDVLLNILNGDLKEPFIRVAMNRFCTNSTTVFDELITIALHSWYFERDHINMPYSQTRVNESLTLGFLSGEYNFTHLAYPLIRRVGCSVAKYDHTLCIFCFYDPYHRHTDGIMFEYGEPATNCPPQYPINDLLHPKMCTRNLYLDVDEKNRSADEIGTSACLAIIIPLQFVHIRLLYLNKFNLKFAL